MATRRTEPAHGDLGAGLGARCVDIYAPPPGGPDGQQQVRGPQFATGQNTTEATKQNTATENDRQPNKEKKAVE